jgi:hypothetical protein
VCALLGGVSLLYGCADLRSKSAIRVATALISHNLCSEVFVSGLRPDAVYSESLRPRPGMSLVAWAVHYDVDRTTVGGGFPSRAVSSADSEGVGRLLTDVIGALGSATPRVQIPGHRAAGADLQSAFALNWSVPFFVRPDTE